jgi:hypothetical protein
MEIKKLIYLFLLVLCVQKSIAQSKVIDSLANKLTSVTTTESKLSLLKLLYNESRNLALDSLKNYLQLSKTLLQNDTISDYHKEYIINQSIYLNRSSKYKQADTLLNKNEYKFQKKKDIYEIKFYQISSINLLKSKKYKEALDIALKASSLATELNDIPGQIRSINTVGWIYMEMDQYQESLNWFNKLSGSKYTGYEKYLASTYTNKATCYGALNKMDSCKSSIETAIRLATIHEDLFSLANAYNIKSSIYMIENNTAEALLIAEKSYQIRKKLNDPYYLVSDMSQLSLLYNNLKLTEKGKKIALEAMDIAEKNNISAKYSLILQSLAQNYKTEGNYKEYATVLENISKIKDSTYWNAKPEQMAELETKYETQLKK